jgi:hypothetical protein
MKKLLLAAILLALIVPTISAQPKMFGLGGAGCVFTDGAKTKYSHFLGWDTPIYTDTLKGYRNFTRVEYRYVASAPKEVQSGVVWDITQKSLISDAKHKMLWLLNIGIGVQAQVKEGKDDYSFPLKLETGLNLSGGFGVSLGADYIPINDTSDKVFVYFALDFLP